MRKLITVLILISTIPVLGQNHILGLRSGISTTNVNSSNYITGDNDRIGFVGGLTYEYQLNNRFNIGLGLLYSQKGFTNDMIFTDEFGIPTGEKVEFIYDFDYLSLPFKGGILIGDKVSGFVNIGLVPSLLINAKTIQPTIEGFVEEETIDLIDYVTKFDFGGLVEIGGSYKFNNGFSIFTSFAYQQSFTSITNENYFSEGKAYHYGMTLSIGLKYKLE